MTNALAGAIVPFVILLVIYLCRRCRASLAMLVSAPIAIAACAAWAIVPDLPRVVGRYGLYDRLARDPRTNIFFWHHTVDRIEGVSFWFNVAFALILLSLLLAAWRELVLSERT